MRHSAISEEEVDFQEHCVRNCGQCSHMGLGKIDMWELTKLLYATRFGFYALGPNWPHVPEWLEEAS
jgi:hypothetical protein